MPEETHAFLTSPFRARIASMFCSRRSVMSTATPLDRIGVGIDTARYGHRVTFLKPDRLPAAKTLTVLENRASYRALQQRLQRLHEQHPQAHFHIRIDAAGQYAANLERFLRQLSLPGSRCAPCSPASPAACRSRPERSRISAPSAIARPFKWQRSSAASAVRNGGRQRG